MKTFFAQALIFASAFAVKNGIVTMVQEDADEVRAVQQLVQTDQVIVVPKRNECYAYSDYNFRGSPLKLIMPERPCSEQETAPCYNGVNLNLLTQFNGSQNDSIVSVECGQDVRANFCQNSDDLLSCKEGNGMSMAGMIRNPSVDSLHYKKFSRVILTPYYEDKSPNVTVFKDRNCSGMSESLPPGKYNALSIRSYNILNDSISSVRVPRNMYIVLYELEGFQGVSTLLDDSTYDNPDTGYLCKNVGNNVDNTASSFEIFEYKPSGALSAQNLKLQWVKIAQGQGSISYEVTEGVKKSSSVELTTTDRKTLAKSLSSGISFMYIFGASVDSSKTEIYEKELSERLSQMLETGSETKITATCESENKEEPVAMWQYQIQANRTDRAGFAYANTSETTCTRGTDVNVKPKCPPNMKCTDATCMTCAPI